MVGTWAPGTDVHLGASLVTRLHSCSWRELGVDEPHRCRLVECLPHREESDRDPLSGSVISKLRVTHRAGFSECVPEAFERFQRGLGH